jgi:hypothetical protein
MSKRLPRRDFRGANAVTRSLVSFRNDKEKKLGRD